MRSEEKIKKKTKLGFYRRVTCFLLSPTQKKISAAPEYNFASPNCQVLHPSATLASALSHATPHSGTRARQKPLTHGLHPGNYITLPSSENYIRPSPSHQSLPRSPVLFWGFSPPPSSLPLTILVFSLHFNLALNCRA